MPGKTKLALSPRGEGLIVAEDPARVIHLISTLDRSDGGFVKLTADSGHTLYVAVGKILYIEPE